MSRYRKHRVYQTNALRPTPRRIRIKIAKVKYKERILKVAGEKKNKDSYTGIPMKPSVHFFAETFQARK